MSSVVLVLVKEVTKAMGGVLFLDDDGGGLTRKRQMSRAQAVESCGLFICFQTRYALLLWWGLKKRDSNCGVDNCGVWQSTAAKGPKRERGPSCGGRPALYIPETRVVGARPDLALRQRVAACV